MNCRALIGDRQIEYELTRKKVKNINLRIHPDGRITVSADSKVPEAVIDQFILSKGHIILNTLDRFARINSENKSEDYSDGDTVRLFSEVLTLRIMNGKRNAAVRTGDELRVYLKNANSDDAKRRALDKFFRNELKKAIEQVCQPIYGQFDKPKVELSDVKIRRMSSRWGSCNCRNGAVTINLRLANYPIQCLEFVLAHEFCHLHHPNHSKDFYVLLSSVMPEWKNIRKQLNNP